jgi:phenylacetate-CoA ligase
MNKTKPPFIYGYPSSIYLLADYCLRNNIQELSFKAVFCTAEVLLPKYRQVIESVFNCKVYNQYGSYDGGVQALECEEHCGFHISAEKVIVEIVDDEGNIVENGKTGRIIVTDLHNYAMPFIRYEVGDIGALSNKACPCGRDLPLLQSLQGRTSDIIKLSNGVTLAGPAVTLIFKDCNVKQYQLVQTDHNKLLVNIVKGENYSEADEKYFMGILKHHAGSGVSISVEYLDTIPLTQAGKYRFIINQYINI